MRAVVAVTVMHDCDACTVVCVACVCAVRVRGGDGSAGVGSG